MRRRSVRRYKNAADCFCLRGWKCEADESYYWIACRSCDAGVVRDYSLEYPFQARLWDMSRAGPTDQGVRKLLDISCPYLEAAVALVEEKLLDQLWREPGAFT